LRLLAFAERWQTPAIDAAVCLLITANDARWAEFTIVAVISMLAGVRRLRW
jgi:hypothetical protein